MRLRCIGRDAESASDLPGGRTAGNEGKHLDLAGGEPGGSGAPLDLLAGGREHGIHSLGGQTARPDVRAQLGSDLLWREGWPVRPWLAHGVPDVGGSEDSPGHRDRRPGQAAVVAGPVQALISQ